MADGITGGTALRSLTLPRRGRTRRISSYDTTGGNHDFWKVAGGATVTLADISGAGQITHLWFTINAPEDRYYLRNLVLRCYWDGEDTPSVEVPLGDFFNMGHGIAVSNATLPITTSCNPDQEKKLGGNVAMNCYWQMSFNDGARLTLTNDSDKEVRSLYFYVDHETYKEPVETPLRFHAQFRRERLTKSDRGPLAEAGVNYWSLGATPNETGEGNYVILETSGRGHFVGCNVSVDNIDPTPDGLTWWGEGDDMFYIDGESVPSIIGTGSEDYFGHAWGMQDNAYPYQGTSLHEHDKDRPSRKKCTNYRFHIEDPVMFDTSLKVTIEHGHANLQENDYSSVAYWYQSEPHSPFPAFPDATARRPRPDL